MSSSSALFNAQINSRTTFKRLAFNPKTGKLTAAFRKYVRNNLGFFGEYDLLKDAPTSSNTPDLLAYNPHTDRIVKRSTVYTKKGQLRKKYTQPNPSAAAEPVPSISGQTVIDSFQSFTVTRYTLENVNTLQQFYNLIISRLDQLTQGGTVKLFFKNNATGGFIFRTCMEENLQTFEEFEEFIADVFAGNIEGSDGVNQEEYFLFMNIFDINTYELVGLGSSDNILFHCEGFDGGKCYADVLKYIDPTTDHDAPPPQKVKCDGCGELCVPCWAYADMAPFWGCGTCRKMKNGRSFASHVCDMNPNDAARYAHDCPRLSGYEAFMHRLESLSQTHGIHFEVYANSFTAIGGSTRNIRQGVPVKGRGLSGKVYNADTKRTDIIGPKRKLVAHPLRVEDVNLCLIASSECKDGPPVRIVFDAIHKHFDIITQLQFNNCFLSLQNTVYRPAVLADTFAPIYACKHLNALSGKTQTPHKVCQIFWDLETVIDVTQKNVMVPYSVAWVECYPGDGAALSKWDAEEGEKEPCHVIEEQTHCVVGYDCLAQFVAWLIANQKNKRYELVSFNGASFDHFLLLDYLLHDRSGLGEDFDVSNIFYNGSSVLSMTMHGRHTVFDLARHVVGSLSSNCAGFKVQTLAKSSFDHHHAQKLHDAGQLIEYMTGNAELIDYNKRDVLSLAIIFERYRDALRVNPITKKYSEDLCRYRTIGGMVWDIMGNHWKRFEAVQTVKGKTKPQPVKFPKLTHEQYRGILDYKTAGRVQLFNGVQRITEPICSKDIASMYPYVMACADVWYPCGSIVETAEWVPDKIGFYWCDIDQRTLKAQNLPNIVARKDYATKANGERGPLIGNDWAYDGVLLNYCINSITIEHLRANGCTVDVHRGFYFTDKIRSCDCFRPVLEIMGVKIAQDRKKKAKNPEYNPALRETSKLCMNSVSGKVIEGLHLEKVVQTDAQQFAALLTQDDKKRVSGIHVCGSRVFASYTVNEEDELGKQRPVYLGALIYAYAQRHIYETGYKVVGLRDLVYTDTDSFKARAEVFEREDVKNYNKNTPVPVWDDVHKFDDTFTKYADNKHPIYSDETKVFGSYEEELPFNNYSVFAQKKGYLIVDRNTYDNLPCMYSELTDHRRECLHMGFKGVPKNSLVLSLNESFVSTQTTSHKDGTQTVKYIIRDQKTAIDYFNEHPEQQIQNNAVSFADTLYEKREAFVLTTSFRKIVKNTRTCEDLGDASKLNNLMHKIQVCAVIKKITIEQ